MLHTVSVKPCTSRKTCPQLSPPLSRQRAETTHADDESETTPPCSGLLWYFLRFQRCCCGAPRTRSRSVGFVRSVWRAAKLRKHAESCGTHKRTASPQNSSTHILLSNPSGWPRPSLYPCTFDLLPRPLPESGVSSSSH